MSLPPDPYVAKAISASAEAIRLRARVAELERYRDALREQTTVVAEMLETLRVHAPGTPLNNHRFDAMGIRAHAALDRARALLAKEDDNG